MRETWRAGNNRPVPALFICDQCAQKDEDKDCRVGKHMQNGKEAEEKQNDVKPDQRRLFCAAFVVGFWIEEETVCCRCGCPR